MWDDLVRSVARKAAREMVSDVVEDPDPARNRSRCGGSACNPALGPERSRSPELAGRRAAHLACVICCARDPVSKSKVTASEELLLRLSSSIHVRSHTHACMLACIHKCAYKQACVHTIIDEHKRRPWEISAVYIFVTLKSIYKSARWQKPPFLPNSTNHEDFSP